MPFFAFDPHQVYFQCYGQGSLPIIALHGFGDEGGLFAALQPALQDTARLYALDLPYHGQTSWQSRDYHPQEWMALLEAFCKAQGIERFILAGYSMGGHVAMHLAPLLGARLCGLWLFAPAGIQHTIAHNRWLFNLPVRRGLRWTLSRPQWMQGLFTLAYRLFLLNRSSYALFSRLLQKPAYRERLLDSWISLYRFPADKNRLKAFVRQQNLPVALFYGEKDDITPQRSAVKWAKGLPNSRLWTIPQEGHLLFRNPLLVEAVAEALRAWTFS